MVLLWCGVVVCDVVVVWCGVVWYGVVWCCVVLRCVVLCCVVHVLLSSIFVCDYSSMEKGGTRGLLCGFVCQGELVIGIIRSMRIQFPEVKFLDLFPNEVSQPRAFCTNFWQGHASHFSRWCKFFLPKSVAGGAPENRVHECLWTVRQSSKFFDMSGHDEEDESRRSSVEASSQLRIPIGTSFVKGNRVVKCGKR